MRPQMLPISWHEHVSLGTTSVISQTVPIRPTSAPEQAWHRRFLDHKIMTDMANLKWNMEPEDGLKRSDTTFMAGVDPMLGHNKFHIKKMRHVDQCWGYTPCSNTLKWYDGALCSTHFRFNSSTFHFHGHASHRNARGVGKMRVMVGQHQGKDHVCSAWRIYFVTGESLPLWHYEPFGIIWVCFFGGDPLEF